MQQVKARNALGYSGQVDDCLIDQFLLFTQTDSAFWCKRYVKAAAAVIYRFTLTGTKPVWAVCSLTKSFNVSACLIKGLLTCAVLSPLCTDGVFDLALDVFREHATDCFPCNGLHLTGLQPYLFGSFTVRICNQAVCTTNTELGVLAHTAKVMLDLRVCSSQCLVQTSSHCMGINGDMTYRTIGRNDVVVEGTNLVLFSKLLADVLTGGVAEYADGLFNRAVG